MYDLNYYCKQRRVGHSGMYASKMLYRHRNNRQQVVQSGIRKADEIINFKWTQRRESVGKKETEVAPNLD